MSDDFSDDISGRASDGWQDKQSKHVTFWDGLFYGFLIGWSLGILFITVL